MGGREREREGGREGGRERERERGREGRMEGGLGISVLRRQKQSYPVHFPALSNDTR